jgi:hypothetical protein
VLFNAVRGIAAAYLLWWIVAIVVGVILGQVVSDAGATSLHSALRGLYGNVPFAWPIVSFAARNLYYGPFDLRMFGPSPSTTTFARSELGAMVTITLILVCVAFFLGILAVRARRRRSPT